MSSIVLSGDTSGSVTVSAPAVAGTQTVTLPVASGVLQVSGNMPAFSAYMNSNQSVSAGIFTAVACNVEEFDTANAFNNTGSTVGSNPAYSFNPQVAGYYQINAKISTGASTSVIRFIASMYKNGSEYKRGNDILAGGFGAEVNSIVYLNGSTDYVTFYGYINAATPIISGTTAFDTYFNGVLVRGA